MPRHIEQPAERQSKPASRKTSSRPSASACAFTFAEPGTTIASTETATRRPFTTSAAARRSPIRELVQEPDEHAVEADVLDRRARLEAHVVERAAVAVAARLGHGGGHVHDHRRVRAPAHLRGDRRGVDLDLGVEARAVVADAARASPPRRPRSPPARPAGPRPTRRSCRRARPCRRGRRPRWSCCRRSYGPPSRGRWMAGPGVLDHVAHAAVHADPPDRGEDQVLGRDAGR